MTSKSFDLETFTFNGKMLRAVTLDGKLWFPSQDVGRILDYHRDGISTCIRAATGEGETHILRHSEASKELQGTLFPGSNRRILLVSEPGLYKFVLRAQRSNPAARDFQDWVTQEVMPRIRKHGGCPLEVTRASCSRTHPQFEDLFPQGRGRQTPELRWFGISKSNRAATGKISSPHFWAHV
ncbi:BRO-N domain-containing protein [Fuscibacter oryzae]|uniref:Bro-N domain-containing protein n=1 Tax=Fuscibacter oryzae TaxID=2803939 RepID=A0A8J7SRY2_9RHOB|nr:BRO family protein [Fuscibacter oryzae]MBL4927936.1 hypothetical protein [Fuscibacter oryzae]